MEVLAIVARSGKFLPVCLTFGPVNGPDDFCYVVDRAFGPGRGRKNRYTREWVAYVDDLTIRTGRVVDGSFRTDAEHEEEVRRAMRDAPVTVGQPARDALEALGVQAEALGTKGKHDPKVSDHNHPRITSDLRVGFALGCGTFLGFGLGGSPGFGSVFGVARRSVRGPAASEVGKAVCSCTGAKMLWTNPGSTQGSDLGPTQSSSRLWDGSKKERWTCGQG